MGYGLEIFLIVLIVFLTAVALLNHATPHNRSKRVR